MSQTGFILYSDLLKNIENLNGQYCSVRVDGELKSLSMPFWSYEEIQKGLALREDWDVPLNLIPFQGDWHEIFCLDQETGQIIYLNDDREFVFVWKSVDDFMNSLSKDAIADGVEPKIVGAWLNPEIFKKLN